MIIAFLKSKDFLPKAVCLCLAVALWTYIGNLNDGDLRIRVKTEIKDLSEGYVVTDFPKRYQTVRVHGNLVDLEAIDRKKIVAYVDLANPIEGQPVRYSVELEYPDLPESVRLIPSSKKVFITVDKKISKKIFVTPKISGKVKEGYLLGNVSVNPGYVTISGPRNDIEKIKNIETETIEIDSIDSIRKWNLELNVDNYELSGIDTKMVTVRADVFKADKVLIFESELDMYGMKENYSYEMSNRKVSVYLKYSGEKPPTVESNDIKVWVDFNMVEDAIVFGNGIEEDGMIVLPVDVNSIINRDIPGLSVLTVVPEKIKVTIRK